MIHSYAITDPAYYGTTPLELNNTIGRLIGVRGCDFLCLRDKTSREYRQLAEAAQRTCNAHHFHRLILHGDIALAYELGVFGIHLTAAQMEEIPVAKAHGLYTVVSTHDEIEMQRAIDRGADAMTYSPVFTTPNKGTPKGLEDLKEKTAKIGSKIIALGGIVTPEQIAQVETAGAYAFASIRYFVNEYLEEMHV